MTFESGCSNEPTQGPLPSTQSAGESDTLIAVVLFSCFTLILVVALRYGVPPISSDFILFNFNPDVYHALCSYFVDRAIQRTLLL